MKAQRNSLEVLQGMVLFTLIFLLMFIGALLS
jgi:hypothetical protein